MSFELASLANPGSLGPWAIVCGVALGIGLWSLLSRVPRFGRARLASRVAPYLVDISEAARSENERASIDPLPVFGALFRPLFVRLRALLERVLGGGTGIELRLRQAGSRLSLESYRSRQLAWLIGGLALGAVIAVVVGQRQGSPVALAVAIALLGGVVGVVACDRLLQHQAARRIARMTAELPMVLEFLTLSLSAGEGILEALRRVARISRGELAGELAAVVSEVGTGLPLAESLTRSARQLRLAPFTRCVEQITGALERGSPLAEVLRAQAQDAREETKRELLEVAGKKEVAMLVPLVFLILPMTILFAVFPGLFVLQLGF